MNNFRNHRTAFIFLLLIGIMSSINGYAQNERTLIRDGNKHYQKKKFSDAEVNYRKSMEKNNRSFEGNYNLGNALYRQDKMEEATNYFSGSAALTKDNEAKSDAYYNLGNSLLKSDKYQESVDAYKNALKINPKDEQSRYNLSYALSKMRQQQQQQQQNDKNKDNKDNKKKPDENKKQQADQKKQDQKQQADNKNQQGQSPKPKISKEDAERMLQALKNDEKNLQKKLAKKFNGSTGNPEKDW